MNEYISREAAMESVQSYKDWVDKLGAGSEDFIAGVIAIKARLANDPPAADVTPVVRCKECEHWGHDHDAGRWCWCRSLDIGTAPDFYCKDGCRMDGGEHHAD